VRWVSFFFPGLNLCDPRFFCEGGDGRNGRVLLCCSGVWQQGSRFKGGVSQWGVVFGGKGYFLSGRRGSLLIDGEGRFSHPRGKKVSLSSTKEGFFNTRTNLTV